jgi:ABC-type spermidine/putrescine transport system permease subunit II
MNGADEGHQHHLSRSRSGWLATAEVFRRSGSIWTTVVAHVVFNLPTIPAMIAAGMS